MSDGQATGRRGPMLWLAGKPWRFWMVLILTPTLYVASIGPAAWLSVAIDSQWTAPVYNFVYTPLRWCGRYSPLFNDILVLYIRLWIKLP